MGSKADLFATPGVVPEGERAEVEAATKGFVFQQTMYRIKDPKRSLEFYTRVLGFRLLERLDFPDAKFSLYFLGFQPADAIPEDKAERVAPTPLPHTHAHCFVLKKRFSCLLLVCSARGLCTGARAAGMTRLPNLDV